MQREHTDGPGSKAGTGAQASTEAESFPVPGHDGDPPVPLARVLRTRHPDWSWSEVRRLCAAGRVRVDAEPALDARRSLHPGSRVEILSEAAARRPGPATRLTVRFEDRHVIVVEKPAGISTVPFEEGEKGTLLDLIRETWARSGTADPEGPLLVVQRLDRETSGVMVIARSELAQVSLGHQLRRRTMQRTYLAIVNGVVKADRATFESFLGKPREEELRRSVPGGPRGPGKLAITHVEVVERLKGATLVRCQLETGRTHQIRIHLAEAGHPLLGERIYLRGFEPDAGLPTPRLALHATSLGFTHPVTHRKMFFDSRLPPDLAAVLYELGSGDPAVQRKMEVPTWAERPRGKGKVRNLKDLLSSAAEISDWNDGPRVPKPTAVKEAEGGWIEAAPAPAKAPPAERRAKPRRDPDGPRGEGRPPRRDGPPRREGFGPPRREGHSAGRPAAPARPRGRPGRRIKVRGEGGGPGEWAPPGGDNDRDDA